MTNAGGGGGGLLCTVTTIYPGIAYNLESKPYNLWATMARIYRYYTMHPWPVLSSHVEHCQSDNNCLLQYTIVYQSRWTSSWKTIIATCNDGFILHVTMHMNSFVFHNLVGKVSQTIIRKPFVRPSAHCGIPGLNEVAY